MSALNEYMNKTSQRLHEKRQNIHVLGSLIRKEKEKETLEKDRTVEKIQP
jgi:hypothetical protein